MKSKPVNSAGKLKGGGGRLGEERERERERESGMAMR